MNDRNEQTGFAYWSPVIFAALLFLLLLAYLFRFPWG